MSTDEIPKTVAVFAPLYPPAFRGGGPIRSISSLVRSAPDGTRVVVLTGDRDLGRTERLPVAGDRWTRRGDIDVYYANMHSLVGYVKSLFALRATKPVLLHFNSFMNPKLTILPLALWRIGFWGDARILLSPRGEFGEGALQRRSTKKRIYLSIFRLLRFHEAVIWHSTAAHETEDLRHVWGLPATIVERGNDTMLASSASAPRPVSGPLSCVFLGRIVAHKGLHIALEALAKVTKPVRLDVYGSREDDGYARKCEALAAALPSHITVRFHGEIRPDHVVDAFEKHELLLMPTAGENFGHVIAEALSASCAVAVTPLTPWTEQLARGGGFVLAREPAPWTDLLEQLADAASDERMSHRLAAGAAYARWAARPLPPHVWTSVFEITDQRE